MGKLGVFWLVVLQVGRSQHHVGAVMVIAVPCVHRLLPEIRR